ncbi:MAG: DNA-directed RNA polymerase [Candidatus Pacearchaeota archaeon]
MFYLTEMEDHVRVEPELFGLPTIEAVQEQLQRSYTDHYDKDIGKVVSVVDVMDVGEGVLIAGDGAAYYKSRFKLLVWKPELHELVLGTISEITNFGAFINMGCMKGIIHISQTMEDFVSVSKEGNLLGKTTKRNLNEGDMCLARIIAISHKGAKPKIGLTMRQPGLGRLDWIEEDLKKKKEEEQKQSKSQEKSGGSK